MNMLSQNKSEMSIVCVFHHKMIARVFSTREQHGEEMSSKRIVMSEVKVKTLFLLEIQT